MYWQKRRFFLWNNKTSFIFKNDRNNNFWRFEHFSVKKKNSNWKKFLNQFKKNKCLFFIFWKVYCCRCDEIFFFFKLINYTLNVHTYLHISVLSIMYSSVDNNAQICWTLVRKTNRKVSKNLFTFICKLFDFSSFNY